MTVGTIVRGLAGRDRDGFFVVVRTDGGSVFICDGKRRPVDRPKRKNPKHLQKTRGFIPAEKLLSNRSIKKAINEWRNSLV